MKIQFCSDLHFEFPENRKFLARNPLIPAGDVLILAGDIVCFPDFAKGREFVDFVCDHYSAVFWVPGNHEYYGSDITQKPNPLHEKIRENFHLVNNHWLDYGGLRFVFSTLWSKIGPQVEWDIQRSISDFTAIQFSGAKFTAHQFTALHEESVRFLRRAMDEDNQVDKVIVTHHVPTMMHYPAIYRNSVLNQAFATEMFDLIVDSNAACWIYGHHHVNTPEFMIGKTRMITNQLGYVRQREHESFRNGVVVDL